MHSRPKSANVTESSPGIGVAVVQRVPEDGFSAVMKRMLGAGGALLLTGLSFTVFVSAEPRALESRAIAQRPVVECHVGLDPPL